MAMSKVRNPILILFLIMSSAIGYVHADTCGISDVVVDDEGRTSLPDEFPHNRAQYNDAIDRFKNDTVPGTDGPRGTSIDFNKTEKLLNVDDLSLDAAASGADLFVAILFILGGLDNAIEVLDSDSASDLDKATAATYWIPIVNVVMADIDLFTHVAEKDKAIRKVNDHARYLNHVQHYKDNPQEDADINSVLDAAKQVVNTDKLLDSIHDDVASSIASESFNLSMELAGIVSNLYPIYAEQLVDENPIFAELTNILPYALQIGVVPAELYTHDFISDTTRGLCRVDYEDNLLTTRDGSTLSHIHI